MDGGCLSIWLREPLNKEQRLLLKQYEDYLHFYKMGYSFLLEYRMPEIHSGNERRQIENAIGYIPQQELYICGLAKPMFRAIEAIIKYFDAYLSINVDTSDVDNLIGEYYPITGFNKHIEEKHIYHLVNWEFVAGYFNTDDDKKIKDVYSLERFSLLS